jgi:hypothetical protein
MAALGSLVVSLEANMAKFTSDMGKAAYQTEQAMQQMQRSANVTRDLLVGMAQGIAGALSVGLFVDLVRGSIDAADSLRDMSQKTGIAVETLNGLGLAASMAGGSLDGIVAAAGKLNKSIAEAGQGGNEQAAAFQALGISVKDASGNLKTADVVMAEMADKFTTYADGPEKVAIAMALMGKSGADQIPVLNEGGEAMRANIDYAKQYSGVTTELAGASDNFNDTLGKLHVQQQSFANTLTAALLPVLQAVASETLNAAEQSNGFSVAANAARTVLETFVVVGSEVAFVFKGIGTEIGGMAAQLAALASGDLKGFSAISDAMKADAARARAEHDKFIAGILDRTPTVQPDGTPAARKPSAPALPKAGATAGKKGKSEAEKLEEDAQRFVAKLKEQAETFGMSGTAVLEYQMNLSKFPQVYKDQAIALQKMIDAKKEAADQEKADAAATQKRLADQARAVQRNEGNVARIRISLMTEEEQQRTAHEMILDELQTFHDTKLENVALANELIEQENARHQQALADMQASHDLQSLAMMGNTADQLYGLLQKSGQDQSDLGKAVFLASKAIAVAEILLNTEVAAAKASAQAGIFGIPMAMMIRATGYASAGMVAGMAIAGMREKGGAVWGGGAFVVGEKGPEIFKPTGSGTIIPNSALGGASNAPMTLTIVNNTSAKIGQVTEQRISQTERALIIQEAVSQTAAQLSDPNSRTSRAMGRSYAVQRSR